MELKTIKEIEKEISEKHQKEYVLIRTEPKNKNIIGTFVESKFVEFVNENEFKILNTSEEIAKTAIFMELCWSNNMYKIENNGINVYKITDARKKTQIDKNSDLFESVEMF